MSSNEGNRVDMNASPPVPLTTTPQKPTISSSTLTSTPTPSPHAKQSTSLSSKSPGVSKPPIDLQQLQLIQLCFGEHEFGVICEESDSQPQNLTVSAAALGGEVDDDYDYDDDDDDDDDSLSSTYARSSSSASSSSSFSSQSSPTGSGVANGNSGTHPDPAKNDSQKENNNNNNNNNKKKHKNRRRGATRSKKLAMTAATTTELTFDYDPFTFVEEKLASGVTLDDLCRDLDVFIEHLQARIMQHVHKEVHEAFVTVSGQLVGTQEELRFVLQRLNGATGKVEGAVQSLSQMEKNVEEKLQEATAVELERNFDVAFVKGLLLQEKLCDAVNALPAALLPSTDSDGGKLESKGGSGGGGGGGGGGVQGMQNRREGSPTSDAPLSGINATADLERRLRGPETGGDILLHQIQSSVLAAHQLQLFLQSLPHLPKRAKEISEAESRVQTNSVVMRHILEKSFLAAYNVFMDQPSSFSVSALRTVMMLYERTGETPEFCRMLRDTVMRSFLETVISWKTATQARQSVAETAKLLERLKDELSTKMESLLPVLRGAFQADLAPVATIICPVVCKTLVTKMVNLYDSGIPSAFHTRFVAAHDVMHLLENHCATKEELYRMRQSADVVIWEHKWNLDAYHVLRTAELSKRMETAREAFRSASATELAAQTVGAAPTPVGPATHFNLELFRSTVDAIIWLFSDDVYLFPVTAKFVREAVSIMEATVTQAMAVCKETGSSVTAGSAEATAWMTLSVHVGADCRSMQKFLRGPLLERIEVLCGKQLCAALAPIITQVGDAVCLGGVRDLNQMVTARVEEECLVGLQNVKSVRSAYSRTRKPTPTGASWYIPSVIEPIQHFHKEVRALFSAEQLQEMVAGIVEEVALRFVAIAKEMLVTAKRTEESLQKLRGQRGGANRAAEDESAAAAAGSNSRVTPETASDLDKMVIQIYLDALAYEEEVQRLGIDRNNCAPLQQLFTMVRRANWILGENIPEPPYPDDKE